jgi:hypothetical protein
VDFIPSAAHRQKEGLPVRQKARKPKRLIAASRIEGGDRDRSATRFWHAIDHLIHSKENDTVRPPRATGRRGFDVADRERRASGDRYAPQLAAGEKSERLTIR